MLDPVAYGGEDAQASEEPQAREEVAAPSPMRRERRERLRAALLAEVYYRLGHEVASPKMVHARAAQEALLPHDEDGKLLPVFCPWETFRIFGAGVYAYVCWMKYMEKVFLVAFAFSLPNLIHNAVGGELSAEYTTWMTIHTLGNVEHVNASYGAVEFLVVAVFFLGLVRGTSIIDKAVAEVNAGSDSAGAGSSGTHGAGPVGPEAGGAGSGGGGGGGGDANGAGQNGVDGASVARRTLMVRGLPAVFGTTAVDESAALMQYMSQWGAVQHIKIARKNRGVLLRLRARQALVEELHLDRARLYLARVKRRQQKAQRGIRMEALVGYGHRISQTLHELGGGAGRTRQAGHEINESVTSSSPATTIPSSTLPSSTATSPPPSPPTTTTTTAAASATSTRVSPTGGPVASGAGAPEAGDSRGSWARRGSFRRASGHNDAAPHTAVSPWLQGLVDRVDRAKTKLRDFDSATRRLARQRYECAGTAFVTYASPEDADDALVALASRTETFWSALAPGRSTRRPPSPGRSFRPALFRGGTTLRARLAPEPSDIIWEDLAASPRERFVRQLLSTALTLLIIMIGTAVRESDSSPRPLPQHREARPPPPCPPPPAPPMDSFAAC